MTKQDVLDFLKRYHLATISMVQENGLPDASSIYYVVQDDGTIFFLTRMATQKYNNIRYKNEVILTVTDGERQETLKLKGRAFPIPGDTRVIEDVITSLAEVASSGNMNVENHPIFKRTRSGDTVAIKIKPYEIRMSRYGSETLEEEFFSYDDGANEQ